MKRFLSILNIEFLIKDDSFNNWRMILFISFLCLIMITSGHNTDKKIFLIAKLNSDMKSLKSQFIEIETELMNIKKETNVIKNMSYFGINPASSPPFKILIKKDND
jgi:hypothetical protein